MNIKLRTIEVDDATATALETRAARSRFVGAGAAGGNGRGQKMRANLSRDEVDDLDRQWAAIKAGAPTVAHDDVVRWLDTSGY